MKSVTIKSLLESPLLPELVQEGQRALAREQRKRRKFYDSIAPESKWEFIQGEVVMHSPAVNRHLVASQNAFKLLDAYVCTRRLGLVRHEKAMTVFPRNDYEPDVMYFGIAKAALVAPDTLRLPIPDLIVEVVSPSTEARDRGIKFVDYGFHGVAEYWIVDPVAESVEVYRLEGSAYPPAPRLTSGVLVSDVVPGFEAPVRGLFDEHENLAELRRIMV